MLIFSYIISASLEATLSYNLYQANGGFPGSTWIYVLLLCSSLLSIPIECSAGRHFCSSKLKDFAMLSLIACGRGCRGRAPVAAGARL